MNFKHCLHSACAAGITLAALVTASCSSTPGAPTSSTASGPASALAAAAAPVLLGEGAQQYRWVHDWLSIPLDSVAYPDLGATHGEIVIADDGRIVLSTETAQAIMLFRPDGKLAQSWGAEFAGGVHGMTLTYEQGQQVLYFVHTQRHEIVKATLDGKVLWRTGTPMESGRYQSADQFKPTSVAVGPDGRLYVADGYGENCVLVFDAERHFTSSFGGAGTEPGRFQTPHGIWVDTRHQVPEVLVADRENHRLQRFDLDGTFLGVVQGMFRRPCKIQQRGEFLVVPDLAGRVTILDGENHLVCQLGDNPDESLRANFDVPQSQWFDGRFLAPHSAAWDADGNLFVMDWNRHGRVNKLARVRDTD